MRLSGQPTPARLFYLSLSLCYNAVLFELCVLAQRRIQSKC